MSINEIFGLIAFSLALLLVSLMLALDWRSSKKDRKRRRDRRWP